MKLWLCQHFKSALAVIASEPAKEVTKDVSIGGAGLLTYWHYAEAAMSGFILIGTAILVAYRLYRAFVTKGQSEDAK